MVEKMVTINSKYDNVKLSCCVIGAENPSFVLQIVHGMAEHKARYYEFMKYIASNKGVCIIHDHRGHGLSVSNKNELGYFGKKRETALVEDVFIVRKYINDKYLNLPIILLGHSMGSMIVRLSIGCNDQMYSGLIVSGSPSKQFFINGGIILSKLIGFLKKDTYHSKLIHKLAFDRYDKAYEKVDDKNLKNIWLSKNKDNVKKYNEDNLCGFYFTCNGFESVFTLIKKVYTKSTYNVTNKFLPILVISGEDDPCTGGEKKFKEIVTFIKQLGYCNIKSKLYKEMRHEIFNETEKLEVWQDVLEFCNHIKNI